MKKDYILEITKITKVIKNKYLAQISLIDTNKGTETPYKVITVEAINQEFAKKIIDIKIEEMLADSSEQNLIIGHNNLIKARDNYINKYKQIVEEYNVLTAKQEKLLEKIIYKSQPSEVDGLDIKHLNVFTNFEGEDVLVWAIRVVTESINGNDVKYLDVKISSSEDNSDLDWYSIYDTDQTTAGKILTAVMETI